MKIRLISGSCYVALLVAFYCLKIFVHDFFFDGLLYTFSLLGTFEMLRAVKEGMTKKERGIVYIFAAICIPVCALSEHYLGAGLQAISLCTLALSVALLSLLVAKVDLQRKRVKISCLLAQNLLRLDQEYCVLKRLILQ